MDITSLVGKIKSKKSLSGISNLIVNKEVENYMKKNKIRSTNLSEKDEKIIIQDVRAKLRKISGSFNSEKAYSKDQDILNSHSSTRERVEFYPELENRINSLGVKSILDLGCGINPLALAKKGIAYHAFDINEDNLKIVSTFFKSNKITGKVQVMDLREKNVFPDAELCIMFKILDLIDEKDHKNSESLIKSVNAKYLLISFSTKTLSGVPMNHPQRGWIEHLLTRLGYSFECFVSKNEIFYLAKQSVRSS